MCKNDNVFFHFTTRYNQCGFPTDMALKTKGKPAILLLEMLKLTSFSPMAVIMSERQVEDAALRDDAVDGCG